MNFLRRLVCIWGSRDTGYLPFCFRQSITCIANALIIYKPKLLKEVEVTAYCILDSQVWYLIVSIPDLCTLNYFYSIKLP